MLFFTIKIRERVTEKLNEPRVNTIAPPTCPLAKASEYLQFLNFSFQFAVIGGQRAVFSVQLLYVAFQLAVLLLQARDGVLDTKLDIS